MELGTLNTLDIGIMGVMVLSTLIGGVRGFVKESLSLATWIAATAISVLYFQKVGDAYLGGIQLALFRYLLAGVLLSLATLIVGGILNYTISSMIKKTGFKLPDRIIGVLFGGARGFAFLVIAVLVVLHFPKVQTSSWRNSVFVPFLVPSALWFKEHIHMPENIKSLLESTPQILQQPKKEAPVPGDILKSQAPVSDTLSAHSMREVEEALSDETPKQHPVAP